MRKWSGKWRWQALDPFFLGMENASKKNLQAARKGNILDASRKAVLNCHKYGIMVVGGMIFGVSG